MSNLAKPGRNLVSQSDAALIERGQVPRSTFHGSWTRKTAFDAGKLVPILVEEVLPGDHLKYQITAYVRLATPLFPLMDNQRIDTFFFFVPNRIVWDNWVRLMGEQTAPGDHINYVVPKLTLDEFNNFVGNIYDHMGIPPDFAGSPHTASLQINELAVGAYNLIFNEWFRDQNLQQPMTVERGDGNAGPDAYYLATRNKAHDYFTSALPWPQKFTAPTIPLAGMAPVGGIGVYTNTMAATGNSGNLLETGETVPHPWTSESFLNTSFADRIAVRLKGGGGTDNNAPDIYANLAGGTGIDINVLRQAWLVQSLLERDARSGSRYTEQVQAHFGVRVPDFRLQRPEYIGGGQTPLQLTPIAQTAPGASSVVGQLGAAGTAAGTHSASFAATEHGYIVGLINVRTDLSYQQGLHKMWTRSTRFDFYYPALAGLGEQAILRSELYVTGDPANDNQVFGYQERFHEYRTRTSEVCGIMRSAVPGTLDNWHLAQHFGTPPVLNDTFLKEAPPMSRVLAAGNTAQGQQYLADIAYRRTATRALPMFGTPVSIGRF